MDEELSLRNFSRSRSRDDRWSLYMWGRDQMASSRRLCMCWSRISFVVDEDEDGKGEKEL
jgi:hypothetical protein